MSEKSSIAKDMLWNVVGNIVYCIAQWTMTIAVVRLSSYENAGYLALAMTTSSTFSTLGLFSMRNYQVSDIHNEFHHNEYAGSRLITGLLALVLCFFYSFTATNHYQMLTINLFMCIRLSEDFVDVLHGIDQKLNRYDLIGKSFLIRSVFTFVFFIGTLVITGNLALALGLVAVSNLATVYFFDYKNIQKLQEIHPIIWNDNIKRLLKICIPLVVTSFLLSLIPLIPKQNIQRILGTDILGIYSSISSPTLVVQIFASYAFNPLLPRISALYQDGNKQAFKSMMMKIMLFFVVFAAVIYVGAAILGRFGLALLYGQDILKYYYTFFPLVGCTLMTAYVWIMIAIVTSMRTIRPMVISMIASIVITFGLSSWFIQYFGLNGASYIQIVSMGIFLLSLIVIVFSGTKRETVHES